MSVTITRAPACARPSASARPLPCPAPVIMASRPWRRHGATVSGYFMSSSPWKLASRSGSAADGDRLPPVHLQGDLGGRLGRRQLHGGHVPECERRSERDPGAGVVAPHHARGIVADGVEALDRL